MSKVSIIIPIYNTEKYLEQCLDSVKNQTLKDIEIICIDDGSTDNSLNILKEYSSKDNRFVVIKQNKEFPHNARNMGLQHATGEYIGFVDSDDWIDLNFFEILYTNAKKQNADIARTTYKYVYEDYDCDSELNPIIIKKYKQNKKLGRNDHSVVIWNAIYKTSFLREKKIDYFDYDLRMFQDDIPFTARVTMLSGKTIPCVGCYYYYRQNREGHLMTLSAKKIEMSLQANIITTNFLNTIKNKISRKEYINAYGRCIGRLDHFFRIYIKTEDNNPDFIKKYLDEYSKIAEKFKCINKYSTLKKFNNNIELLKNKNYELYVYKTTLNKNN